MKELFKALAEFQDEVPVIHEETKGYNYTYSNMNTIFKIIKPLLKKHGLGFTQYLLDSSLCTIIFHIESGEKLAGSVEIPKVTMKGMNEYQSLGSGITYLRRYSLSCMLGLITDKDIDAGGDEETKKVFTKEIAIEEKAKGTKIGMLVKAFDMTEAQIDKYNKLK